MLFYQYRIPHVKDTTKEKIVLRPSYLWHGNPHTWKKTDFILIEVQLSWLIYSKVLMYLADLFLTGRVVAYALSPPFPNMAWWRHQMETFPALLALCAGNSPGTGEFPSQRPVTRSFDVFFDLCLNKWLSKQLRGRWFDTPSTHYDVTVMGKYTLVHTSLYDVIVWMFVCLFKYQPDNFCRNQIKRLGARCENHALGCPWTGRVFDREVSALSMCAASGPFH